MHPIIRRHIRVTGMVQGVGFRPYVWNLANELGLVGWVNNDSLGVTIVIQGTELQVQRFLNALAGPVPPLARVDSIMTAEVDVAAETGFQIVDSSPLARHSTPVSPDISICDDCKQEMDDPTNRRHGYPFINCTNCGPRFTIVEDIPYDRSATTMKSFSMCDDCQREYHDPADRRFHAQPNACPYCGPTIWFEGDLSRRDSFDVRPSDGLQVQSAVTAFHSAIRRGQIVAIKGIGGFHLACDATNDKAVATLRERKGRVDKPFALLVRDIESAKAIAMVSDQEIELLMSKERPIVLLSKKHSVCDLAAPGNRFVGLMLPYSPLHHLLAMESPIILTSGNLSDEPIVRTNSEARERLAGLADCFLLHDREINVVCDDSVVRCVDGAVLPIRRSRGYAPMPVDLSGDGPSVLAVGGEIKSTFCVTKDRYAFMSQHIGDMGNLETLGAMRRSIDHFLRLFRIDVEAVCADLHPDYLSAQWAASFADSLGVPLLRVQHHVAHIASLIAEHRLPLGKRIIGCCFDGTGYGTDGVIWGGEFMVSDGVTFERVGHLNYMPLPGGDASIRRPYRIALAQLWSNDIEWKPGLPCVDASSSSERRLLRQQLDKDINCVATSSMGRLFDAVASLIGVRHHVNYEAQAAMEMEAIAENVIEDVDPCAYSLAVDEGALINVACDRLLHQICTDLESGVDPPIMAAQFHHAVANAVTQVCQLVRDEQMLNTVGLTGGVFQNVLLQRLTKARLVASGFDVLTHSIVPPNDGGIALGQAFSVRNSLR